MIQDAVRTLVAGGDLNESEAYGAMSDIMGGVATQAQTGAFLASLAQKGETVEEVAGCARAMRDAATPIQAARRPLTDTAGTGGDGRQTFNISTAAAFVIAGAGGRVAKHGNRAATSRCGSADVLEALGVALELPPERVGLAIDEVGIGFLFAQALHGAMRYAAPARRELGVPTVFNLLGPLTNPARAERQLVGVTSRRNQELVAGALVRLGTERSLVVRGAGGADEATLEGPSEIVEVERGETKSYEIDPESLGLMRAPVSALVGGDPDKNARLLLGVLHGEDGPRRDAVLLNAALGLRAAGIAADLGEGVERAKESIDSGRALRALEHLVAFGRGVGR